MKVTDLIKVVWSQEISEKPADLTGEFWIASLAIGIQKGLPKVPLASGDIIDVDYQLLSAVHHSRGEAIAAIVTHLITLANQPGFCRFWIPVGNWHEFLIGMNP